MSGSALASAGPMAGFPRARLADGQWVSTHLFYPGDRNRVLLDFVLPVASRLVGSGAADRFFFIRYYEEGPHVRLRLRIDPDRAGEIEEQIARGADNFFSLWPVAESSARALARAFEPVEALGSDGSGPSKPVQGNLAAFDLRAGDRAIWWARSPAGVAGLLRLVQRCLLALSGGLRLSFPGPSRCREFCGSCCGKPWDLPATETASTSLWPTTSRAGARPWVL